MTKEKIRRSGLLLIDGIAAVICVSILASLAMPCLLHLRSSTRLESCVNQIREITLATHHFHDAHRRLPPATLGYAEAVDAESWGEAKDSEVYWKNVQNSSSVLLTAPFMELNELYEKVVPIAMDFEISLKEHNETQDEPFAWQGEITGIENIMEEFVDKLLCPEDDLRDASVRSIIATQPCKPFESDEMDSHDECRDIAVQFWDPEMQQLGLSNYVACLGVAGVAYTDDPDNRRWVGAMSPRQRVTLERISDGTSRTLMYGESIGEIVDGNRIAAMTWLWGGGARLTGNWPLGAEKHPDDPEIPMLGNLKYSSGVGFGLKHDGVLVFSLCDGSVHQIKTDVNRLTLYELAGAADGGVPLNF